MTFELGLVIVLVIVLCIALFRLGSKMFKKEVTNITLEEENAMDTILNNVYHYGKRNKHKVDSEGSYNEFRQLEKNGLKVKVSISQDKKPKYENKNNYPNKGSYQNKGNYRNNNYNNRRR